MSLVIELASASKLLYTYFTQNSSKSLLFSILHGVLLGNLGPTCTCKTLLSTSTMFLTSGEFFCAILLYQWLRHYKIVVILPQEMKKSTRGLHCRVSLPKNGLLSLDAFQTKTICTPKEINPQNFSSLRLAKSEELGNKQTNTLTEILLL